MINTICKTCGKEFLTKAYRLTGGKRLMCSRACRKIGKEIPCYQCGKLVYRKPSDSNCKRSYCSYECSHKNTLFQKGFVPWNQNMKGIHLSPHSEFRPGIKPINHQPIGTVKIRTRNRDGKPRAFVKVAEPNKWIPRSQMIWIAAHGQIPKGNVIHHKDRNTLNDDLENLQSMTVAEHLEEHRDEFKPRSDRRNKSALQALSSAAS